MVAETAAGAHQEKRHQERDSRCRGDADEGLRFPSRQTAQRHAAQGDAQPRYYGIDDEDESGDAWHIEEPHKGIELDHRL